MSKKDKILIIYGSLNSVPSPEGAAPAKIIYETVISNKANLFDVLSNSNKNLKGLEYDKNVFLHVSQDWLGHIIYFLLRIRYSYAQRRNKFITGNKMQLLYYISVCRFLIFSKYDKIIVHVGIGLVEMIKSVFPNKKVIFYHHGTSLHSKLNETQWNTLISNVDAIIGVNKIAIEKANVTFQEKLEVSKCFQLNNAVIPHYLSTNKRVQSKSTKDSKLFHYAFSGRICVEKGVLNLLNSFMKVHKENPDVCLSIIGGAGTKGKYDKMTVYLKDCMSFVVNNDLPVVFPGFLDKNNLAKKLEEIDVIICPTDKKISEEGMPLSIIEAFSFGKPVIATNSGGNPEVVIDMYNGIVIKPYPYIDKLAENMLLLSKDKMLYEKLSNGALKSFKENHTYTSYLPLFKEVLSKTGYI